jgi:hypothetical protein
VKGLFLQKKMSKHQKNLLPYLMTGLILFLAGYRLSLQMVENNLANHRSLFENNANQTAVKKVSYGDGEYEKVLKRWKIILDTSYQRINDNMLLQQEQVVILNYINLSSTYFNLWKEMIAIETSTVYREIHHQMIEECFLGKKVCDSYIQSLPKYNEYFRKLAVIHYKNQPIGK